MASSWGAVAKPSKQLSASTWIHIQHTIRIQNSLLTVNHGCTLSHASCFSLDLCRAQYPDPPWPPSGEPCLHLQKSPQQRNSLEQALNKETDTLSGPQHSNSQERAANSEADLRIFLLPPLMSAEQALVVRSILVGCASRQDSKGGDAERNNQQPSNLL